MRPFHILISTWMFMTVPGCIHTTGPKNGESLSRESSTKPRDTLVHSIPEETIKILDTLENSQIMAITSYQDLLELFEKLNYTPEAWQAGIREVPRVYLTIIGDRWGSTSSKEVTIENKKRIFFRGIAPMILRANELILDDRQRLDQLRSAFMQDQALTETDQKWLLNLAGVYKVEGENPPTASMLNELWKKVDIVPPSLALAQGAEESGWGTSRFAAEGNAVYGQWTWGENAIAPKEQRKELGNYGIAAFGSLQESVSGYMLNLNTHPAYAELRSKRAELRAKGEKISGSVLAEQLIKYSERGEEYVKTLKQMMEYNRLEPTDDAYLSADPPIFLVPAVE